MNPPKISLLLADVDGTLVDSQKRVTPRAAASIARLRARGIGFSVTSGRPPRGLRMNTSAVEVTLPVAAFNGGLLVQHDDFSEVIERHVLEQGVAEKIIAKLAGEGLDVWVYAGLEWYLRDAGAPHREKEEHTVQFPPTVVPDFSRALEDGVLKVTGVSDNLELVARVEKLVQAEFGGDCCTKQSDPARIHDSAAETTPAVSAARSQPYYLDVTHPLANKGSVVRTLSRLQGIPVGEIATIGDQPNDTLMFRESGLSIAMGQSSDDVKRLATHTSPGGLDDEGFARAVEKFILGE